MAWTSNRRRRPHKPLPSTGSAVGDKIIDTLFEVGSEALEAGIRSAGDALLGRVGQAAEQVRQRVQDTRQKIRGQEPQTEVVDSDDPRPRTH